MKGADFLKTAPSAPEKLPGLHHVCSLSAYNDGFGGVANGTFGNHCRL